MRADHMQIEEAQKAVCSSSAQTSRCEHRVCKLHKRAKANQRPPAFSGRRNPKEEFLCRRSRLQEQTYSHLRDVLRY